MLLSGTTFKDLTGRRYGRLVVLECVGRSKNGQSLWRCACDCGGEKTTRVGELNGGSCKSCGCLQRELMSARTKTHGLTKHRLYGIWHGMRKRCNCPTDAAFKHYGGRGITVCDRWNDFASFVADMEPTFAEGLTVERRDNDKGYSPDNCYWATMVQQGRNRRNNIYVRTEGGPIYLRDAAKQSGIAWPTLLRRHNAGWPAERMLEPIRGA